MEQEQTDRLAALIRKQQSLYEQLDELSQSQREMIDSGKTDALLGVLGQRQGLVEQIVEASEQLEVYRANWDELVESMPDATRNDVRRRMERLGELMKSIADRDSDDRVALDRQRGRVGEDAKSVRAGGSAMRAYGATSGATPKYQDRRV